MSSGGECGGEGWVLTGGVGPLYLWFSSGLVSALSSSGILSLSMREKITVGCASLTSSPSAALFVSSSSLICPTRSGVLVDLVGEFSAYLT